MQADASAIIRLHGKDWADMFKLTRLFFNQLDQHCRHDRVAHAVLSAGDDPGDGQSGAGKQSGFDADSADFGSAGTRRLPRHRDARPPQEFASQRLAARLTEVVREMMRDSLVVRVNVFSRQGIVIFSTDRDRSVRTRPTTPDSNLRSTDTSPAI